MCRYRDTRQNELHTLTHAQVRILIMPLVATTLPLTLVMCSPNAGMSPLPGLFPDMLAVSGPG